MDKISTPLHTCKSLLMSDGRLMIVFKNHNISYKYYKLGRYEKPQIIVYVS